MNGLRPIGGIALLACLGSSAAADAPMIYCTGSGWGDFSPREYTYAVESVSYPTMEFRVGTDDPDSSRSTNVLTPDGWHFVGVSLTFRYDDTLFGEEVGWALTPRREGPPSQHNTFQESRDFPVGSGYGPVHGPWLLMQAGDLDFDGDVDLDDYVVFAGCLAGPDGGLMTDCAVADFENDGDVDLRDFQDFQIAFGSVLVPHIGAYSNSGCMRGTDGLPMRDFYPCPGDDEIDLTVVGSTLDVVHRNATYNCCPDDIVISLVVQGNLLKLTEEEILTFPCFCICCYEVQATVVDLASGTYTVEFCWDDYETGGPLCIVQSVVIP